MSGETEEMTADGVSVVSNLLWSDNPELEYFRSMMNERDNMNDSLIGDSTLDDMMDGELQMMESIDSISLSRESTQRESQRPRHAFVHDTTGLSQVEDDTIDNINTEDGSILAWFSRQRKERARRKEDGTLDSDPAPLHVRQLDPSIEVQDNQPPPPQQLQKSTHRSFFSAIRKPQPVVPQYAHEDNIEIDASVENPNNICIPGFIFVTSGQSASVQTRASGSHAPSRNTKTINDDEHETVSSRHGKCVSTKIIILCLSLAIVISGIMLAIIFTSDGSSSTSSTTAAEGLGSTPGIPTIPPQPTNPPSALDGHLPPIQTSSTSPSIATVPTIIPGDPTTSSPMDIQSSSPSPSIVTVPSFAPHEPIALSPTAIQNTSPSLSMVAVPSFVPNEATTSSPIVIQSTSPSPSIVTVSTSNPTAIQSTSPSPSIVTVLTFVPIDPTTSNPTATASTTVAGSPTTQPLTHKPTFPGVASRLEDLSPESEAAWLNLESAQSLAATWLINDPKAERYSDLQLTQRYFLATLFYSTNGENWDQSTSWLVEGSDECTWWGINCTSVGGIRILQLPDDNLSGLLPPEIQLLSAYLEELYLNGNNIRGPIPTTVGLLSKLRRLQLTGNSLSGEIPTSLSHLSSLRLLSVKNNQLQGTLPSELGELSVLRNLDISKNNLVGSIPESFGKLDSLDSIYLSENQLTGTVPVSFAQLHELSILRLERNNIYGVMPLGICGVEQLSADCKDEVTCEPGCCSVCCEDGGGCVENTNSPTLGPTVANTEEEVTTAAPMSTPEPTPPLEAATLSPTNAATSAGTEMTTDMPTDQPTSSESTAFCSAYIETDKVCYENGDNILVTFENCDSTRFDWIAIYSTSTDSMNLGEPLAWVWSCGDQFCNEAADAGQAIFYNARGTGSFLVYLLRSTEDLNGTFIAYGVGNTFQMATNCAE